MRVFERALAVVGNNVANVSTPGYAKQGLTLVAKPFQPNIGLGGGVSAGDLISFRNSYAEQAVRNRQQTWGRYAQNAEDLAKVEAALPVTEDTGIPAALSRLFQGFSALAVTPNDSSARQVVLDRAADVARNFNQTSALLQQAATDAARRLDAMLGQINHLAETVRTVNWERRQNFESVKDAGLDAQLHTALEDLAELVNFTLLDQPDGTVTVLLGGQVPLVIGDSVHPLRLDTSGATPRVVNDQGHQLSGIATEGRLAALVELTTKRLPSYIRDLDKLAEAVATVVNQGLRNGLDASGNPPTRDLFLFDPLAAAATLTVNDLSPGEIAAAAAGAPGGNRNALAIADLAVAKTVDGGYTFAEYYGKIAGRAGRELAEARANESVSQLLVAQARTLRGQISGVNLDEEAARLVELQRSYQAAAKMFQAIDEMTRNILDLIR